MCRNCYLIKETNHQCPLKFVRISKENNRLAFFKIVLDNNALPLAAIFLREEAKRGHFTKYIFATDLLIPKQKED